MIWWVLTYLDNYRPPFALNVLSATNLQAHLFMKWSTIKPSRRPVYKRVRAVNIWCGYEYIWDTPNLVEQSQPGITFEHLFAIDGLKDTDHIWYYLFSIGEYPFKECQGPLIHVSPPVLHEWTPAAYIGTKLKGVYYTDNFTGPQGTDPTWVPRNGNLHDLRIWQLEPDAMGLPFGLWALAGAAGSRTLYKLRPFASLLWEPRLTNTQCVALTGALSGEMCWVAVNRRAPQQIYVLFNTAIGDVGVWCIKSIDSGLTWAAFQITPGVLNLSAGNISVGLAPGTSPHPSGSVLYTRINWGLWWSHLTYLSTDWGETWALKNNMSMQMTRLRCMVDPTDYSIVYVGSMVNLGNPQELFRSEAHGAAMVEVDGLHHLGIYLEPEISSMWIHETDHNWLATLSHRHLWTTLDYCVNWADHGPTFKRCERLRILSPQPEHLYLARDQSASPIVHPHGPHVLYVSDDYGATMWGKAGAHPGVPEGAGDSIPYNCGGVCLEGMQLFSLY